MKLLLDQNLSYRLLESLSKAYPGSAQVGELKMGEADDWAIWEEVSVPDAMSIDA